MKDTMKLETHLVIADHDRRCTQRAVNPIIQRTSSLIFGTVKDRKFVITDRVSDKLFYDRRRTYTHSTFQKVMSELEGGVNCALYPCDTAAMTNTILALVQGGGYTLMTDAAYEPIQDFYSRILGKFNIETTYCDPLVGAGTVDLLRPETKVVFLGSPSPITMEIQNVPRMVEVIHTVSPEIIIIIDSAQVADMLLRALNYDVDISIQAGTRYTIGHPDSMLDTAMSNARCWDHLRENSHLMGQVLNADTVYNGGRGLRTLTMRLEQHQEGGIHIARWLSAKPEVAQVNHPTLSECLGRKYFQRDFIRGPDLFSSVLKKRLTDEQMANLLDNFSLFRMAYSQGGFRSLTLANQPEELNSIRPAGEVDFSGTLVRVHTGLEGIDDLIANLEAGFAYIV